MNALWTSSSPVCMLFLLYLAPRPLSIFPWEHFMFVDASHSPIEPYQVFYTPSKEKNFILLYALYFNITSYYLTSIFFLRCMYLFLSALGLHSCTWASSSCSEQGCPGFSSQWLLLLRTGSRCPSFSHGGAQALAALWHVESSRTRDWTTVPCIGRQILND